MLSRFFRLSAPEQLLRVAVAFAFLYPAIDAVFEPSMWLGYLPPFATAAFHVLAVPLKISDVVLLHAFGLLEFALALWLLAGRSVRIPAVLMAVILFIIVGLNLDPASFSVVFRDISIALAALAIAFMPTGVSQKHG